MTRLRLALTLIGACSLALGFIGPAGGRAHAQSNYGGTLFVGIQGFPTSLDPTLSRGLAAIEVYKSFCEQLYDFDARSRLVPQLAAALPVVSKDKLTYTISLRHGIEFNDGTPFNAQAVAATLQRMISFPGSTHADELSSIASITTYGPYTVVIHLKTQFTPIAAYAFIVFVLLYMPCVIASVAMVQEFGTWKWYGIAFAYQMALAWGMAALVYQGGRLLGLGG